MHPDPHFAWHDRDAMRAFVREVAFGALFVSTRTGPGVVHLPVVFETDEVLGLHFSRRNRIGDALDGATALFVAQGPNAYVSPDWYRGGPDEVPTWNYVAVELEGTLSEMPRDALVAQIDQLGHEHEARLAPKPEWRRDKVDPAKVAPMLDAIVGYRLTIEAWRGTAKLNQNKADPARLAAADALDAHGRDAIARWMRNPPR